jgi:hypothetical protein
MKLLGAAPKPLYGKPLANENNKLACESDKLKANKIPNPPYISKALADFYFRIPGTICLAILCIMNSQ